MNTSPFLFIKPSQNSRADCGTFSYKQEHHLKQLKTDSDKDDTGDNVLSQATADEKTIVKAPTRKYYISEGFRNKTKGEGYFNALTYTGVGYFGVTAFSIYLTYLLRDKDGVLSRGFKNYFVEPVTNFFTRSKSVAEAEKIAAKVDSNMNIAALFTGGTIVSLLPIKWLEDHKPEIVKKLDYAAYGKERVENDPEIIKAHKELSEVPRQTWRSVAASRLLSFAATYSTSFAMGDDKSALGKKTGLSIDRAGAAIGRHIDGQLHRNNPAAQQQIKAAAQASPGGLTRNPSAPDRIGSRIWGYIAMDGFYTLITSKALFVFTRVFAPIFDKRAHHTAPTGSAPISHVPVHTAAQNDNDMVVAQNDNPPSPVVSEVSQSRLLDGSPVLAANR